MSGCDYLHGHGVGHVIASFICGDEENANEEAKVHYGVTGGRFHPLHLIEYFHYLNNFKIQTRIITTVLLLLVVMVVGYFHQSQS